MSSLIVIPARGGSKRLPHKNILMLHGKPLISWTIEAALSSNVSEKIVVTSDDDEILKIAISYGVIAHKRDSSLASDTAKTIDVVLDCISMYGNGVGNVLLLQPTSPLRTGEDIAAAMALYEYAAHETVVSVCEVEHPLEWSGKINTEGKFFGVDFHSVKRSQDLEKSYRINGAIYIFPKTLLMENKTFYSNSVFAYVMPQARSIDIDTWLDFKICEYLMLESN